jgi:5-phospho-D-xylono-1,4-lactonase
MTFLLGGLRRRIERELGHDIASTIFIDNPSRAFSANWPAGYPMTSRAAIG